MRELAFNKGDLIFRQGDPGTCLYDIRAGAVGIYAAYGTENEEKLAELPEDAFFGEMALVDGTARSASAVALADGTRVCELDPEDLSRLFAEAPERVLAILQNLSGRLRGLTGDYLRACRTVTELAEAGAGELPDELRERVERYGRIGADRA